MTPSIRAAPCPGVSPRPAAGVVELQANAPADAQSSVTLRPHRKLERLLPGPVERVWAYVTESDSAPPARGGEFDLRVGGRIRLEFDNNRLPARERQARGSTAWKASSRASSRCGCSPTPGSSIARHRGGLRAQAARQGRAAGDRPSPPRLAAPCRGRDEAAGTCTAASFPTC